VAVKRAIRRSWLAVPAGGGGARRAQAGGTTKEKAALWMGQGAWACWKGGRGEDDLALEGQVEVRGGGAIGTGLGVLACGRGERVGVSLRGVVRGVCTGRAEMCWHSGRANTIELADDKCAGVQERGGKRRRASKRGRQGRGAQEVWLRMGWGGVGRKEVHLGI
jgi:hypothetical protein